MGFYRLGQLRWARAAGAVLLAWGCSACLGVPIPYRAYDHPSVRGRVIDAATGAPIPAAEIVTMPFGSYDSQRCVSQSDGTFAITSGKHWQLYYILLPLGAWDPLGDGLRMTFTAEARGRVRVRLPTGLNWGIWLWNGAILERRIDVGDVPLPGESEFSCYKYHIKEKRIESEPCENRWLLPGWKPEGYY